MPRLRASVYDRTLELQGIAQLGESGDLTSLSATIVDNGVSTGSLTLPTAHELWPVLAAAGARVVYDVETDSGVLLERMSGMVETDQVRIDFGGLTATCTVVSDEALARALGWPVPGAGLSAQTNEYDVRTGPVGTVTLDLLRANLRDRLGMPIFFATPLSPGPSATLRCRMSSMWDVIKPPLAAAYRSLRITQWAPGEALPPSLDPAQQGPSSTIATPTGPCLIAEVVTRQARPSVTWSTELGITSGEVGIGAPTATRVVVGGKGEGTARVFGQAVDADAERLWGPLGVRELFVDARDAEQAELAARAAEKLAEEVATAGVSVQAVDGDPWIFGVDYRLGDAVQVSVSGLPILTDRVTQVTFSADAREGFRLRPQIGEPTARTDPDAALARTLRRTLVGLRELQTRR